MPLRIESPYTDPAAGWLKGNLHTHTSQSDGTRPPQEVVDDYASRGYDFLMLSDHDKITDPDTLQNRGMVLFPGNEVSAKGPHLLHVNTRTALPPDEDRQGVLDGIQKVPKTFAIINHPNWQDHFSHCPQERLEAWQGYLGIEIYNGVIRRHAGSPLATDRWDRLLAKGRRVWGFGNDDSHRPEDVGLAWNMVQTRERTAAAILDSLANGRFYASTGVEIRTIAVHGRTIHLHAPNATRLVVVGASGKREGQVDATQITFHVPDTATYPCLRVECYGTGEEMAWTQPFWIRR